MKYTKPAHRLSDVDLKHKTAVCSVCGPAKIYVGKPNKDGVVKRICINKLRKRSQDRSSSKYPGRLVAPGSEPYNGFKFTGRFLYRQFT